MAAGSSAKLPRPCRPDFPMSPHGTEPRLPLRSVADAEQQRAAGHSCRPTRPLFREDSRSLRPCGEPAEQQLPGGWHRSLGELADTRCGGRGESRQQPPLGRFDSRAVGAEAEAAVRSVHLTVREPVADDPPCLLKEFFAFVWLGATHSRPRGDLAHHGLHIDLDAAAKLGTLRRGERARGRSRDIVPRERYAAVHEKEVDELPRPIQLGVKNRAHSADAPARPKHPGDLKRRAFGVKPVPRCRGKHRIGAGIRQRHVLRGRENGRHSRRLLLQHLQHAFIGLDRNHPQTTLYEQSSKEPGSCANVNDVNITVWQKPIQGLRDGRGSADVIVARKRSEVPRRSLIHDRESSCYISR